MSRDFVGGVLILFRGVLIYCIIIYIFYVYRNHQFMYRGFYSGEFATFILTNIFLFEELIEFRYRIPSDLNLEQKHRKSGF